MALTELLRAIEADADAERALAERTLAEEAQTIIEGARREALALRAELAAAPEAQARTEAERVRALARVHASSAIRSAREAAFASTLAGVRARLAGVRETDGYPQLLEALLAESRAALPGARELRVDPRDVGLATPLAEGLSVEATLATWGGLELAGDDGRTIRNTFEERLGNAELLLRRRFAHRLAATPRALMAAEP
jgi:vacuolar-type H+-ATPase subunit E/Vma4